MTDPIPIEPSPPPTLLHDLSATAKERRRSGKLARNRAQRGTLGYWQEEERARRSDDAPGPESDSSPRARSHPAPANGGFPMEFYRGAAAVMACDLESRPNSGIEVQLCGDAHVLNFGLWATPERNLMFDLRDFDETLPGPFEWDVKRLAASLVVVARENGVKRARADAAVTAAVEAYRQRMRRYTTMPELDIWYDGMHVDSLISYYEPADRGRVSIHIEKKQKHRTSRGAFAKLITMAHGDPESPRSHRSGWQSTMRSRLISLTTSSLNID